MSVAPPPPRRVPAVKCAGGEARMMDGCKDRTLGAGRRYVWACGCVGGHIVELRCLKWEPRDSNTSKTLLIDMLLSSKSVTSLWHSVWLVSELWMRVWLFHHYLLFAIRATSASVFYSHHCPKSLLKNHLKRFKKKMPNKRTGNDESLHKTHFTSK